MAPPTEVGTYHLSEEQQTNEFRTEEILYDNLRMDFGRATCDEYAYTRDRTKDCIDQWTPRLDVESRGTPLMLSPYIASPGNQAYSDTGASTPLHRFPLHGNPLWPEALPARMSVV